MTTTGVMSLHQLILLTPGDKLWIEEGYQPVLMEVVDVVSTHKNSELTGVALNLRYAYQDRPPMWRDSVRAQIEGASISFIQISEYTRDKIKKEKKESSRRAKRTIRNTKKHHKSHMEKLKEAERRLKYVG